MLVLAAALTLLSPLLATAVPCEPVRLASKATVQGALCRCNGTYCDTIEPLGTLPPTGYIVYTTSLGNDTERLSRSAGSFPGRRAHNLSSGFTITVNTSGRHQTITGFGAAFTDAAALAYHALSPAAREKLLESYFAPTGLRYSLGRIPIGASDFSLSPYSYNDAQYVDDGQPAAGAGGKREDLNLSHFSVEMDEASGKLPMIRAAAALSQSGVRFFGSCWQPPVWMTQKNSTLNARLRDAPGGPIHQAYARYLRRFVTEYASNGVAVWAITGGNEPSGNTGKWQDLEFSAAQQRDFIKIDLGPALEGSGVKLMILDDQRSHLPGWASTILSDGDAAKYVDGIGVHWYTAVEDFLDMFPRLAQTHASWPDVFILGTEACEGFLPWSQGVYPGDWWRAERYAHDILGDVNAYAVGWTDWNMCLDLSGGPNWAGNQCDSPLLVDTPHSETTPEGSVGTFYKQPMYYYLGHIAAFVPPGSVRTDASTHAPRLQKALETSAFVSEDGARVVVVVLNRATSGRSFTLACASARGPSIAATIPPSAMQTYVFAMPPNGC